MRFLPDSDSAVENFTAASLRKNSNWDSDSPEIITIIKEASNTDPLTSAMH